MPEAWHYVTHLIIWKNKAMILKTETGFILKNSFFSRELEVTTDGVHTVSVVNRQTGRECSGQKQSISSPWVPYGILYKRT